MKNFLSLLRVKQWVKNVFILVPLIFSGYFMAPDLWSKTAFLFGGFSFLASGMYILNDIYDRNRDRLHPKKSSRPIAAGRVSIPYAGAVSFFLLLLGGGMLLSINRDLWVLGVVYMLLQALYNYSTKKHVILDVLTIALGFELRIWLGSLCIGVLPSLWLQMCVFVLALFLGFTKRRYEITELKEKAAEHRGALSQYSIYFLDQMVMISATLSIVFYGLYTISPEVIERLGHNDLLYTLPFVIYGIFRYLYLVHVKKRGDDPGEVLLSDVPLLVCILLWVFFIVMILLMSKVFL